MSSKAKADPLVFNGRSSEHDAAAGCIDIITFRLPRSWSYETHADPTLNNCFEYSVRQLSNINSIFSSRYCSTIEKVCAQGSFRRTSPPSVASHQARDTFVAYSPDMSVPGNINTAPPPSSFDGNSEFYEESRWAKLKRKLFEEPLIPLGCALTCWALYEA